MLASGTDFAPKTRLLMDYAARVDQVHAIARCNGRDLTICPFAGGEVSGPRLNGTVLPVGGDWAEVEAENLVRIDVGAVIQLTDGGLVAMRYRGLWHAPPGVIGEIVENRRIEAFDPERNYLRVIASFETADAHVAWLNHVLAIGIGHPSAEGIRFRFHELL